VRNLVLTFPFSETTVPLLIRADPDKLDKFTMAHKLDKFTQVDKFTIASA
jgi:hypothetical protein